MERAYTLIAYTCGGQKSRSHTYMLITYTFGGQKSKSHAYVLIPYTCGGHPPTRLLHTPAVGKSLWDTPICCSHTPAVS